MEMSGSLKMVQILLGMHTSTLVGKTIMPHLGEAGGATFVTEANFGQRAFAYSAPSGFKALCTANLPTRRLPMVRRRLTLFYIPPTATPEQLVA